MAESETTGTSDGAEPDLKARAESETRAASEDSVADRCEPTEPDSGGESCTAA